MTGLLNAILLGAGLSVLAAALIWLLARRFDTALAGHELGVWRAARYVALLPVLLAPVIYAIPQYEPVVAGVEGGLFADIPVAATTLPPVEAADAGFTAIALSASQMAVLVYLAGLVLALGLAVYRHAWRARIL